MNGDRYFVDTNVLLYVYDMAIQPNARKRNSG